MIRYLPLLLLAACAAPAKHHLSFDTPAGLQAFLRHQPDRDCLVSAHRGGTYPGYPENALETFEKAMEYAPCLIECDVRKSRDGILVLMHDKTLNRTTTGKGPVADMTLSELKTLRLVAAGGKATACRIPTLAEALRWAEGRTILQLDIKGVPPEEVVGVVQAEAAQNRVLILSTLKLAETYHRLDGDLMISVFAKSIEGVERLIGAGVPVERLAVFVSTAEPPIGVYEKLHQHGILATLGTLGNLDRKAKARGIGVYHELIRNGPDMLATDDVPAVAEAISTLR